MSWGVSVTGVEEVILNLNNKLGTGRRNQISREAINYAAEKAEEELKEAMSSFEDTGATVAQTTHSKARKVGGEFFQTKVGWGAGSRWRLEHLNEFGYTRWGRTYRPRGFGKLRAYAIAEQERFKKNLAEKLKELAE